MELRSRNRQRHKDCDRNIDCTIPYPDRSMENASGTFPELHATLQSKTNGIFQP